MESYPIQQEPVSPYYAITNYQFLKGILRFAIHALLMASQSKSQTIRSCFSNYQSMYHRASLGHYLCFLAHFHLLSATNAFEVDFWILDFSFKDFWICAHFHFLSATNTFGGIWDLGFKSFMDMGFVIFTKITSNSIFILLNLN